MSSAKSHGVVRTLTKLSGLLIFLELVSNWDLNADTLAFDLNYFNMCCLFSWITVNKHLHFLCSPSSSTLDEETGNIFPSSLFSYESCEYILHENKVCSRQTVIFSLNYDFLSPQASITLFQHFFHLSWKKEVCCQILFSMYTSCTFTYVWSLSSCYIKSPWPNNKASSKLTICVFAFVYKALTVLQNMWQNITM